MRFALRVVMVLAVGGCTRDLSLPSADRLWVKLPFDVVAPRETMTLEASGGSGSGYSFAFAPNGQLSGSHAALSEAGVYQAGERGFAQDVVRVTDSAGNSAEARVAVGAALSISPALSPVAPGGRLTFVASGGKPPWRFTLEGSSQPLVDGAYQAGPKGDQVDQIILSDATNDPLATARALVSVGSGLVLYPGMISVAPRERLGFVGLGGQPPYAFSLAPGSASGGASIDAATGLYQAGPNEQGAGEAIDRVLITDANGQTAQALVTVGRPLTVSAITTLSRPGSELTLSASGGKPPYAFAFQPRGNRSRGTVDGIGGGYVPGANSGAVDLLQVTDATGSTATCAPFTVGPVQLSVPGGGTEVTGADLDGDGWQDLALLDSSAGVITTILHPASPFQTITRATVALDVPVQLLPYDVNFDGRVDLFTPGLQTIDVFLARFGGALDLQPLSYFGYGSPARSAREQNWIYRASRLGGCEGVERVEAASLVAGAPQPQCLAPAVSNVFSVSAGAHDGGHYVNWIVAEPVISGALVRASSPFEFRYLSPDVPAVVTRSAQLPLPPGQRLIKLARSTRGRGVDALLDDATQVGPERMLVLVNDADSGVSSLWGVDTSGPAEAFAPWALPTQYAAAGITATQGVDGHPLVAAWDTRTGTVPVLNVDPDAGPTLSQTLEMGYPVFAATFVDVNQDGLKDLVTSGYFLDKVDVVWADGDGTFGRRARFNVDNGSFPELFDLDGDGATDVVTGASGVAQVFWGIGSNRQFAVGPSTRMTLTPSTVLAGDFTGSGQVDLFFQDIQGGMYVAPGTAPGAFGVPLPILNASGTQERAISNGYTKTELGGLAAGPDLLTALRDPVTLQFAAAAIVRTGTTTAKRILLSAPPGVSAASCFYSSMNVDGAGVDDVVAACANTLGLQVFFAVSSGTGASVTFGAWTAWVGNPIPGYPLQWVTPPPGSPRRFLATETEFVVFAPGSAGPTVTRRPFPAPLGGNLFFGHLYPSSSLTEPDLVGASTADGTVRVMSWSGSDYVQRQSIGTGDAYPVGMISRSPGALEDVLVGRAAEIIPLINDGTGRLR